jgi:hypothetical protein
MRALVVREGTGIEDCPGMIPVWPGIRLGRRSRAGEIMHPPLLGGFLHLRIASVDAA